MAIPLYIPETEEYAEALKWGLRCVRDIYYYEQGFGLFYQPAEEVAKVYDRWEEFIPLWTSPLFNNMKKEVESKTYSGSDDYDLLIKKVSSVFKKVYTEAIETQKFLRQCTPEDRERNIDLMKAKIGEELAGNIDKWFLLLTIKNNLDAVDKFFVEMKSCFTQESSQKKVPITTQYTTSEKQTEEKKITAGKLKKYFSKPYTNVYIDDIKDDDDRVVQITKFDCLIRDIDTFSSDWNDKQIATLAAFTHRYCMPESETISFIKWLRMLYDYIGREDGNEDYRPSKLPIHGKFMEKYSYLKP